MQKKFCICREKGSQRKKARKSLLPEIRPRSGYSAKCMIIWVKCCSVERITVLLNIHHLRGKESLQENKMMILMMMR
jgi:hypothetical protein